MDKASIIIPVYNEKDGIAHVIATLQSIKRKYSDSWEIIIIDDGSIDGTTDIVNNIPDIVVVRHPVNRGYGAAIKTGIKHSQFDTIIVMDADRTYQANDIPKLLKQFSDSNSEMVVGARAGNSSGIPIIRKPAKWILGKLANYLTQVKIPDINSGLRVMKKEIVMKFFHLLPDGFSFTTTITLAMLTNNYMVDYVPIDYKSRSGRSKIRPIRDTLHFVQLIIRTVLYFDPLKVFLPVSAFFFIASICVLVTSYLFTPQVMDITSIILFISGIQILAIGMLADLIDKRNSRD